jgi:hypothetical protein
LILDVGLLVSEHKYVKYLKIQNAKTNMQDCWLIKGEYWDLRFLVLVTELTVVRSFDRAEVGQLFSNN